MGTLRENKLLFRCRAWRKGNFLHHVHARSFAR